MKKIIKTLGILLLLFTTQISYGQTNKEKALAKANEGVRLEDEEGKIDEAIKLFEEAQQLDPENIDYPYEIAYACIRKKEYKKASDILEKLLNHKDVNPLIYQALGNAYDYQENTDKANETYVKGIKLFPNSGPLYLESGNMKMLKDDYSGALTYYEKGIEKDPKFPSNYYWASKIFCSSNEVVWGLIYGEIFINLERNSKRAVEISKLLYNTYQGKIKISKDSSRIDFCQITVNADDVADKDKIKFPFCLIYGGDFILSISLEKTVDISSLNRMRKSFIESYFNKGHDKTHPNILF
jgi:tetratricopeptide (TPR) repeat protein